MSFLPSTATTPITVEALIPTLTIAVDKTEGYVGDTFRFTFNLTEDGRPVERGEVTLRERTIGIIGIRVTDSAGNTHFDWVPETGGTFHFHGEATPFLVTSSWKHVSSPEITVTVPTLIETRLTISAPSMVKAGDRFTITGRLVRVDTGEGLAGQTIIVRYDTSFLARATTNTDGTYSTSAIILEPKTYTLEARFEGTILYAPAGATRRIGIGVAAYPWMPWVPIAVAIGGGLVGCYVMARR